MARKVISKRPPNPRFWIAGGVVNMRFSYNGQRKSTTTGEYVAAEDWDEKRQQPKSSLRGRNDLVLISNRLNEWNNAVRTVFRQFGPNLSAEEFKQEILYTVGAEDRPGEAPRELLPYMAEFIKERKNVPGKTRTSWGKFASLEKHLKGYAETTGKTVDFHTMDYNFRDEFAAYLFAEPRLFSSNNASKLFSNLNQVLKHAYQRKAHTGTIQQEKEFSIRKVKTKNKVRLTVAELYKIEHFDFGDRKTYDQVRDLFIYGCWTGLRISDWKKVGRANFRQKPEGLYIEIATMKTKTPVLIPVVPQVEAIFNKYDYSLPDLTPQHFNRIIKEVCREAIPDSYFTRIYSKAGQRHTERAHKWKFISSHAARRSFASNMFEKVGSAYAIMQITGHVSEKDFFIYVDLERDKVAATLRNPALELATWRP
jgi:site-specific recombinase XerD